MPDEHRDSRALMPTRSASRDHALLRIASRFAICAALILSALACSDDGLGDAAALVIPGEYRGVAYDLRLTKFADDNDEFARLECFFNFEDPARYAGGLTPSEVAWTTASGGPFIGPLVSARGLGPGTDDDHVVRFEVEVPRSASGGYLAFNMTALAFPTLKSGSRVLLVDLAGKVVPIVLAR